MFQRIFLVFWLLSFSVVAQKPYVFPILPGTSAQLAGTFAELRPHHFHAGIDIKTQQREGLSVLSIDKGYVSRIIISRTGYGNALFVTHPNGHTSVYGHLLKFNSRIASFVLQQQLAAQGECEMDLKPPANQLPLQRGEELGLSGNTGGSFGPHLHFEIRDAHGTNLDPLDFSFDEVHDDLPPVMESVVIRTLQEQSRIQGKFGRMEFSLPQGESPKSSVQLYRLRDTVRAIGEIGLELLAFDQSNGSSSKNGIRCAEVHVDGKEVHFHNLAHIPPQFTDDINVHTDYATYYDTGKFYQKCYRADGNDRVPIYSASNGKLLIRPNAVHEVTLTIWDQFQNKSQLRFIVKGENVEASATDTDFRWSIEENWLTLKGIREDTLDVFLPNGSKKLMAAYPGCFLWDLRKGLPDSIQIGNQTERFTFAGTGFPGQKNNISKGRINVEWDQNSLYDTVFVSLEEKNEKLIIGDATVPLKGKILIHYQPAEPISLYAKTALYHQGERPEYVGGRWKDGKLHTEASHFGTYYLATDTLAPVVTPVQVSGSSLRFKIRDNLSGIKTWRAKVGMEIVILHFDAKNDLLYSLEREDSRPFQGDLLLEVTDNSGNKTTFERLIQGQ